MGKKHRIIKKYSNRRLYDTSLSRYITLDELAGMVKAGSQIRVINAKSGQDLTQPTLAQIILESRGAAKLLPVPLLIRLIRLGDDALSEFMGQFMSWALDLYLRSRQGAKVMSRLNPLAMLPFNAADGWARLFSPQGDSWAPPGPDDWDDASPPDNELSDQPQSESPQEPTSEVAELRKELDELKKFITKAVKNSR